MPPSLHTWMGGARLPYLTFWYTYLYISKDTLRNAVPPSVPMCAPSRPRGLSLCSPGQHESQKIRPLGYRACRTKSVGLRLQVPLRLGTDTESPYSESQLEDAHLSSRSSWAVPESPDQGFGAYRNMYARDGVSVRRRNRMSLGFLAVS